MTPDYLPGADVVLDVTTFADVEGVYMLPDGMTLTQASLDRLQRQHKRTFQRCAYCACKTTFPICDRCGAPQ